MLMWVVFWVGVVIAVLVGVVVGRSMNSAIARCLVIKDLHDEISCGTKKLPNVSNADLISLSRTCFTVVGVGGVGPAYIPSFSIWRLVQDELAKRRSS